MTVREHSGESWSQRWDKVFISHSSGGDAYVTDVLTEVADALKKAGYTVFADKRELTPDTVAWKREIHENLDDCDIGLVLVGHTAFGSDWVRTEVEILAHQYMMKRLEMVVVLLDGVRVRTVERSSLKVLHRFQCLEVPESPSDPRPPAAEVRESVMRYFPGPLRSDEGPHMINWIQRVSDVLNRAQTRTSLTEAARHLGLGDDEVRWVKRPHRGPRLLAQRLLEAGLGDTVPATVESLRQALGSSQSAVDLADELAPTWVDGEAARRLVPPPQDPRGRVTLLNAYAEETALHYIERATCRGGHGREELSPLEGDEAEAAMAAFETDLENTLWSRMGWSPNKPCSPPPGKLYYLVLPVAPGARRRLLAKAVETVRRKAPWLHVVLVVDVTAPDKQLLDTWGLDDVTILPALDAECEREGHTRVMNLKGAVGVRYEVPRPRRRTG